MKNIFLYFFVFFVLLQSCSTDDSPKNNINGGMLFGFWQKTVEPAESDLYYQFLTNGIGFSYESLSANCYVNAFRYSFDGKILVISDSKSLYEDYKMVSFSENDSKMTFTNNEVENYTRIQESSLPERFKPQTDFNIIGEWDLKMVLEGDIDKTNDCNIRSSLAMDSDGFYVFHYFENQLGFGEESCDVTVDTGSWQTYASCKAAKQKSNTNGIKGLGYEKVGDELTITFYDSELGKTITQKFSKKIQNQPPNSFVLNVVSFSHNSATVDWPDVTDPDGDNVFFDVYLNTEEKALGITNTAYIFANLTPETTYEVRIIAKDEKGARTLPSAVSFTTQASPPSTRK